MTRLKKWAGRAAGVALAGAALAVIPLATANAQTSYSEEVYPIIQIRCLSCHQPGGTGYEATGFDLRSYEGLMKGTRHGPMVVPGDVIASNLLTLVEGRARIHMPMDKKLLSRCEQLVFRSWVQQGALDN